MFNDNGTDCVSASHSNIGEQHWLVAIPYVDSGLASELFLFKQENPPTMPQVFNALTEHKNAQFLHQSIRALHDICRERGVTLTEVWENLSKGINSECLYMPRFSGPFRITKVQVNYVR